MNYDMCLLHIVLLFIGIYLYLLARIDIFCVFLSIMNK